MDSIARGALAAIAYADTQDFPLSANEVWRWWLAEPAAETTAIPAPTPAAVASALEGLQQTGRVGQTAGFWYLSGRAELVAVRLERWAFSQRKWRRARRAAGALAWIPFVRSIAVCNTLALSNSKPESDIDVLVITVPGRLWLTRFLVTMALAVRGLWRHGTKIADRICLSFFISEAALDFRPLLLQPRDPYFAHWVDQLVPLLDRGGVLERLRVANAWVREYLPNAFTTPHSQLPTPSTWQFWWERRLRGRLGDALERFARWLQRSKMRISPSAAASGAAVVTNDVLKFHEQDRRAEYRERFEQRLRELGLEKTPAVDQGAHREGWHS